MAQRVRGHPTETATASALGRGDPVAHLLSDAGAAIRRAALAEGAPVRLGVLVNGRADRGRMARQGAALAGPWPLHCTADLTGLRRAVAELLAVDGVNVLALAGGDGTVHHTCNVLAALDAEAAARGLAAPRPRLLLLRGGTMNILARATGHHVRPEKSLRRFVRDHGAAPLGALPTQPLASLTVRGGGSLRHGFVFGSEVVYHALTLYEQFGAGYPGLLRFLGELIRGVAVGSPLFERERWRLGPFGLPLDVEEGADRVTRFDRYTAVVAVTADLSLATGVMAAIRRAPAAKGFHARVVDARDAGALVRMLPALLGGGAQAGVRDFREATGLRLHGPFTLDGERFDDASDLGRGRLDVDDGERWQVIGGQGRLGSR